MLRVRRAGSQMPELGEGGPGAYLLPLSGGESGNPSTVTELGLAQRTLDTQFSAPPSPPFIKSRTPNIRYTLDKGEGMRQGGCYWLNGRDLPKPSLVHSLELSKGLYFVTPGQLVRGLCTGEQLTGPGVISSFRGLAGISCYVIWVLQIATTKPRLSLLPLPLRRNGCS